ncbi:hypothetical protein [Candidatus Palauibacter sp.]
MSEAKKKVELALPKQVHRLVKDKTPEAVVRRMMQTKPAREDQFVERSV